MTANNRPIQVDKDNLKIVLKFDKKGIKRETVIKCADLDEFYAIKSLLFESFARAIRINKLFEGQTINGKKALKLLV